MGVVFTLAKITAAKQLLEANDLRAPLRRRADAPQRI